MSIQAKYPSTCPGCHARIAVGTKVEWSRGNPARHPACVNAVPNHAAPRVAAQESGRYRSRAHGCHTGGNCSSYGSGESCGARDCDGY